MVGVYAAYFFRGIATLALAMTYFFLLVIARHKVPRQSLGMKYGIHTAYFFRGIATLSLAMTRKINCHCEGA